MQLTKFGHSCVLIDNGHTKILFDPGIYSEIPELKLGGIIITHVHADHLDIPKLQKLLENSSPKIITNSEVKIELDKYNIPCEVVEEGASSQVNSFNIRAIGNDHVPIHPDLPKFQNTGYLINNDIFHPGDSLVLPNQDISVLLLPVVAPWSKISETLDYISAVKAKINFPIHDDFMKDGGAYYRFSKMWCEKNGIEFIEPELGKVYEV